MYSLSGSVTCNFIFKSAFILCPNQASKRSLRPVSLSPRPLSPMESLMEEILTPPALKKVDRTSQSMYCIVETMTLVVNKGHLVLKCSIHIHTVNLESLKLFIKKFRRNDPYHGDVCQ